jgi:hypothetical protein
MGGAGAVDDLLEVLVQHAGILAAQHVVRPEHENGDREAQQPPDPAPAAARCAFERRPRCRGG